MVGVYDSVTKRKILAIFCFLILSLGTLYFLDNRGLCFEVNWYTNICVYIAMYLFIAFPILLLFLVTLLCKGEVFDAWKRYTIKFLIVYTTVYLVVPTESGFLIPVYKENFILIAAGLYFITGVLKIIISAVRFR